MGSGLDRNQHVSVSSIETMTGSTKISYNDYAVQYNHVCIHVHV